MNTNDRKFKGLNISIWSIKQNSNFHKWRHSHAKKCLQFFQNFRKSLTCQKTPKTFLSLLVISSKLLEYSRLTDWCFPAYCWDTPVTYLSPPVCPYWLCQNKENYGTDILVHLEAKRKIFNKIFFELKFTQILTKHEEPR